MERETVYRASWYDSPLGKMLLAADDDGLVGLWFQGSRYFGAGVPRRELADTEVLRRGRAWLDVYFHGGQPDFTVPLHLRGSEFQRSVWALLREIPYGTTVTYGQLARTLSARRGGAPVAAQAVGGAVGRNPLSLVIPCHRVVGAGGSLTGYGGGLARKAWLLELERTGHVPPAPEH